MATETATHPEVEVVNLGWPAVSHLVENLVAVMEDMAAGMNDFR